MRRLIEKIIDNDETTIKKYNKNIPEVINIIKTKEEPVAKEKKVIKEKPEKVEVKKEYNENEKFWLNIFNKLGDKND